MSMHLLSTLQGEYRMVELTNNSGLVQNVSVWRHAGDSEDGNEDSWFVEAEVRFSNEKGERFEHPFHLRRFEQHGMPKEEAAELAGRVLLAGKIDMKHWSCSNVSSRY